MNSITVSTANAKTDENHLLSYKFKRPIKLDGFIRLSSAYMWYNWKNITEKLGNNSLMFNNTKIVLPDGSYNVKHINEFIKFKYKEVTGHEISYDVLTANPIYNRITLNIVRPDDISFQGKICYTLGISNDITDTAVYKYTDNNLNFPYIPNLENVKSVQVHCNLVYNELQYESKLLYSFTPNVSYSRLISLEPLELWKQTRDAVEDQIEIYLTDQNGFNLQIEDDMSFTLTLANERFI